MTFNPALAGLILALLSVAIAIAWPRLPPRSLLLAEVVLRRAMLFRSDLYRHVWIVYFRARLYRSESPRPYYLEVSDFDHRFRQGFYDSLSGTSAHYVFREIYGSQLVEENFWANVIQDCILVMTEERQYSELDDQSSVDNNIAFPAPMILENTVSITPLSPAHVRPQWVEEPVNMA